MRRYQSIKRIDLLDRESSQSSKIQSRFQSISKSSQRSISRDRSQHPNLECLTDRIKSQKPQKIHEFIIQSGQSSIQHSMQLAQPQSSLPISSLPLSLPLPKTNIKTFIRFKPFTKSQLLSSPSPSLNDLLIQPNSVSIQVQKNLCQYSFDCVFEPQCTQKNVYDACAKEIVKSFVNGYNGTIFAYGQTGSGKTYTMFGDADGGIIPLAIEDLFGEIEGEGQKGKNVTLSCSMFEIYKETICDLMSQRQKEIKIKENASGTVQIENLTIKQVVNKEELFDWINKGSQLRKTRGTDMNERSSRSHLIFTLYLSIKINETETRFSKLNLVDLAGSQKVSKTKVSGEGLQQAIKINLSLSCLGNTIYALSRNQEHVPFRDSKLTRVLQQSLSGNSITRVIVTCSMLSSCKQETISSLKFANRIKKIKTSGYQNIKKISEQGVNKFMYQTLKASYQSCQQKLQKIKCLLYTQPNSSKFSVDELVQNLKSIISLQSSQNQFLSSFSQFPETFRSPFKQKQELSSNCQFNQLQVHPQQKQKQKKQKIQQLQDHIKTLQSIIVKQERTIYLQKEELEKYRRESKEDRGNLKFCKTDAEGQKIRDRDASKSKSKKIAQKLKILKVNNNNSKDASMKLKKFKNISKQCSESSKQNALVTFRTRYEDSQKKNREKMSHNTPSNVSMDWIKQIVNESSKQLRSFQNMEREILEKQIQALCLQVIQLKKVIKQTGNSQKIPSNMPQLIKNELTNTSSEQMLKKKLQKKDKYIQHLQKIVVSKLGYQLNLQFQPSFLLQDQKQRQKQRQRQRQKQKQKQRQQKQCNNFKQINLLISPTTSCGMSRINSSKNLSNI